MTDQEIRLKFGEMNAGEMRLARALVAWHEREIANLKAAQPGFWPGQQEAIDAAFCSSNRGSYTALKLSNPFDWEQQAPARLAIARTYDAARPQAAEIAKLKAELAASREYESIAPSVQLQRLACEKGNKEAIQEVQKYASTLTVEGINGLLQAIQECLPETQPILADDGRSLGQVQGDAWRAADNAGHNADECNEISAQAVVAVVLAQAVRRMEAVPVDELWYAYEAANTGYGGMGAVRARLVAAVKGEGQDKLPSAPFIQELDAFRSFFGKVSLWLHHIDGQGDNQNADDFLRRLHAIYGFAASTDEAKAIGELVLSQNLTASQIMRQALRHYQLAVQGRSIPPPVKVAKGDGQAMAKNIPGDKCPLCGAEEVESNTPRTTYACGSSDYDGRPETFHPGDRCDGLRVVINEVPQGEKQPGTPAVGQTVRLKSGGDVYTVMRYMAEKDEWACVASPNSGVSYMCVPAACLTPAQP